MSWIIERSEAGESRDYTLRADGSGAEEPNTVTVTEHPDTSDISFSVRNKIVTAYHYGSRWVRPFFHPLLGPRGASMTRTWPIDPDSKEESTDQPHQKSMWIGYGECGTVDNWTELKGHGHQRQLGFRDITSGPVFGRMVARTAWCSAANRVQFEDERDVRVYALPGGERLVDVALTLRMNRGNVTLKDTKEGGLLSVRVATPMEGRHGGRIENAWGAVGQAEAWGQRAPWCDYSGTVDGVDAGIAVMEDPRNPRYPTHWHVRDYGLMAANCFGWRHFEPHRRERGDMKFRKGAVSTWRYRLWIHRGDARRGRVGEKFCDFAAPPRVTHNAA